MANANNNSNTILETVAVGSKLTLTRVSIYENRNQGLNRPVTKIVTEVRPLRCGSNGKLIAVKGSDRFFRLTGNEQRGYFLRDMGSHPLAYEVENCE